MLNTFFSDRSRQVFNQFLKTISLKIANFINKTHSEEYYEKLPLEHSNRAKHYYSAKFPFEKFITLTCMTYV
jgi:hypothetical protein